MVNEYLLLHGYRLTAITFSDENTSAANDLDLDDWDAIGLNVAKPPSVLRLYRHGCRMDISKFVDCMRLAPRA